ncbi:flagellar hook-associated protein FlgK [Fictibacillus sp. Mic-4]|uniref:flagellar hook-associated protein FlgK n=1 Tax=Fictibacillus sp. Mic-4 TaxID=3132826 RepID=UPI003CF441D4
MISTFSGLETARRGMMSQQSALSTTGHNIANANTPGFSRQRVNFQATSPYPGVGMNRPAIPGQVGTGVEAGSIQRVRDYFLDQQYRGEANKQGYWEAKNDALARMEDIMNEPSDEGLSKTLNQFWQSLQDLSANPQDSGARSVVRERGEAVADTFRYISNSLTNIQQDLGDQIGVTVKDINSILDQISSINRQISEIEPNGYLPNDLYDERDNLVDQLSSLLNVKVEKNTSGGNALPIAEGTYNIFVMDSQGNKTYLVQGNTVNRLSVQPSDSNGNPTGPIAEIDCNGQKLDIDFTKLADNDTFQGKLRGLIESYGYTDGTAVKGHYPDMLKQLDSMAKAFIEKFNDVHRQGYGLSKTSPNTNTGNDFFSGTTAKDIQVVIDKDHLDHIAAALPDASGNVFSGDASNAKKLADVKNNTLTIDGNTTTIQSYYESAIGRMAVDAQKANRLVKNSEVLAQSVDHKRQSVSGVSLDEEMTNLIQFQHAYNASARMITTVDQILDKIINGMGVVGR